jgi:tRNA(Leu) C34 or U34 (ribose-2'-O)-methylase TrmL
MILHIVLYEPEIAENTGRIIARFMPAGEFR